MSVSIHVTGGQGYGRGRIGDVDAGASAEHGCPVLRLNLTDPSSNVST